MPRNRITAVLAAVVVTVLVLAGCGGGGGSDGGRTLAIADSLAPESIDPSTRAGTWANVHPVLYQTLTRYPATEADPRIIPTTADLEPALATSWEQVEDGVIFTLDPVRSAAGNTLSAEDVVWTLQRAVATEAPVATFLMRFAGIDLENPAEAIDATNVLVRLTGTGNPQYAAAIFQNTAMAIFDSTLVKENVGPDDPWGATWLATNGAPFGPYSVQAFQPGESVTLAANPNWAEAPPYSAVVVRGITDSGQRLQLVRSGQVQLAMNMTYTDYTTATEAGLPGAQVRTFRQDALYLDLSDPALQDPRVRTALSMAIDREALIAGAYGGVAGSVPTSLFPQVYPVAEQSPVEALSYQPDRARELFAEAGVTSLTLPMYLSPTASSISADAQSTAVFLRDQLSAVGVDVTINSVATSSQFDGGFRSGDVVEFESWLFTQMAIAPDGAYWLNLNYTTDSIGNYGGFSDPAVDDLIGRALAAPAGDERFALEAEAASAIAPAMPIIPLADVASLVVAGEDLGRLTFRYGAIQYHEIGATTP
ncbi:ABC transporter substrate-binding protein [Pseudonocardia sp. NPDC049635]|uniref:ABC transporter substrate-binding protein n=1 Tax=Pseudonocardia sp. NPDC049635 TaxID=3155506 RepID=UPI0033FD5F87